MCYCALIPCTDGIFENQRFIDWKCLQVQIEFYRGFHNQIRLHHDSFGYRNAIIAANKAS